MDFRSLPKVELHLHLDCSLSYGVARHFDPAITPESFRESFIAPEKCIDLADFLSRAEKGIAMMQSREQLHLATLGLFGLLKEENVIYAEIRFAPLEHTQKGLSPEAVVETVDAAVTEGTALTGIHMGMILCTLRHYSAAQSIETVKLVDRFRGAHVAGFDIASDEANFPIDPHIPAFRYALEHGISCTAHAGEARGPESVRETLDFLRPSRIGHGVRSAEDEGLLDRLLRDGIHLEICPTSNIQTNVYDRIEEHPIDRIFRRGISLSINTDSRTLTNATLTGEYELLNRVFGWDRSHFLACNLEAMNHAFAGEDVKRKISKELMEKY